MNMRLTQLPMHWDPDEALAMIQLLDQLKGCSGLLTLRRSFVRSTHRKLDGEQLMLEFEDPIPF
ncbi:MAG: hypothetical protein P8163_17855 [Candidatus Thiodiazotropha sp.]